MKLLSDGSIEWQNKYAFPDSFSFYGDIQQTPDSGYIVAMGYRGYLFRLSQTGQVLWQKKYTDNRLTSLQLTADGGFAVAGFYENYMTVYKLNSDGNVPGCSIPAPVTVSVVPTNFTAQNTTITPNAASLQPTSRTFTVYSSNTFTVSSICLPTLINLSSFDATPKSKSINLYWTTESETDNAGFNLYRAATEDGNYIKINDSLIPAQGTSTQGASYEFIDNNVQNRKTYWYKLEDIDLNGISTMHGPVSATPRWFYWIGK